MVVKVIFTSSRNMVSFSCEACNDTVVKKKVDQHRQRCYNATFTCIDCFVTFPGTQYKGHTSCITEAEKYEKALYKPKKGNNKAPAPVEKPQQQGVVKDTIAKTKQVKKTKAKKPSPSLDMSKITPGPLYKVVKRLAKERKTNKKAIMKQLQVSSQNGTLVLTPNI